MLQAGVISVTARSLVSEWMHDRDNPKSGELVRGGVLEVRRTDRPRDAVKQDEGRPVFRQDHNSKGENAPLPGLLKEMMMDSRIFL
jgi:hypothetical protein